MTTVPDSGGSTDPGGPLIAVCDGLRCGALWRRLDNTDTESTSDCFDTAAITRLRRQISTTPGGVLMRVPYVGPCAEGAVVGVAHRPPDSRDTGPFTWLGGMESTSHLQRLLTWLATGSQESVFVPPALPGRS